MIIVVENSGHEQGAIVSSAVAVDFFAVLLGLYM
jgi:hypothetical protein